jgi:hypothetical protein
MRKILIISPHFPPSNLAAVHRSRLFAMHLPTFGWQPIILMVHEKFYEEKLDYNLAQLVSPTLRIEKTTALPVTKPRLIGDIGLRAFFQLYKKAKALIQSEQIDFLYIPIPSFYIALLGRWLHSSTNIKYGIDYIDPWVHHFPGSEKLFSRHWISTKLANLLEPIAIKKASLITGVARGYFEGVLQRNPHLQAQAVQGAMPYGGEEADHKAVASLGLQPYLFEKKSEKLQVIYAGAMLPKAYAVLEKIFESIKNNKPFFEQVEFHFIGTGKLPNNPQSYNIKPLAERYGLWETIVFEYAQRIPYLDVLVHLKNADGVFILGSTEPHYTPSKTYQGVLSGKPLLAVLHSDSTALPVIRNSRAGLVLSFKGEPDLAKISAEFLSTWMAYTALIAEFSPADVNMEIFDVYSSKNVTGQLAEMLNAIN